MAGVKTNTLPITQNIKTFQGQLTAAQTNVGATMAGSPGTLNAAAGPSGFYTAGNNDAVIKSLLIASDDTSARVVNVYIYNGTNFACLGGVNVPITAGLTGAIANVDVLGTSFLLGLELDQAGKPVLPLTSGNQLCLASQTTLTAAKTLSVFGVAEEF